MTDPDKDEDDRALQRALHAARTETAPEHLAGRVIEQLEYRRRLEAPIAGKQHARRLRGLLLAVGCSAVAAAAATWLLVAPPLAAPGIAPERPAGVTSNSAPVTTPSAHLAPPDPCRDRTVGSGSQVLIDDFEDGDDALPSFDQRGGFWRWARETDAPGTAPALIPVPRSAATARNRLALHVKGGQLNDWGATVEADFRPACYDATHYAGVSFQARGPGRVYLALREVGVIPTAEGGICEHDCHNPHVVKIDLSPEWRSYEFHWADFRQRGINKPALDPGRLNSVAFLIHPEDTPYDLWFDELRFVSSAPR
ncbi:MAG: hypothetical protein ABW061_09400 [Polyangiaceae bacterium]